MFDLGHVEATDEQSASGERIRDRRCDAEPVVAQRAARSYGASLANYDASQASELLIEHRAFRVWQMSKMVNSQASQK